MEQQDQEAIPVGIAPDGTVSAATQEGTLVVELARSRWGLPEVITSVQAGLAGMPREVARYPLRQFLALVLRAMRAARKRGRARAFILVADLPARLRRAQRLALAKFVRVNFDRMMQMAHARKRWMPVRSSIAH